MKKSVADKCPSIFTNLDLDENLKNDLVIFYNLSHTVLSFSFKSILTHIFSLFQAVYTKLCLALGIPWIFESIQHFANVDSLPCGSSTKIFFKITELLYFTRGIFIFIIFICKRSVWHRLKKTYPFNELFATGTPFAVEFRQARRGADGSIMSSSVVRSDMPTDISSI